MTAPDPAYVALKTQIAALANGDPAADALVEQLHSIYVGLLRGGTTTDGFPYPDPTDPIAEGADAIRALAESLSLRNWVRRGTAIPASALATAYPLGWSYRVAATAEITSGGWPGATAALIITFRESSNAAHQQVWAIATGTIPNMFCRSGNSTIWSAWWNAAGPYGRAQGLATVPNAAPGSTSTVTVTFPANRFTLAPNVFTNLRTANPSVRNVAAGSITTTSFVITLENGGSTTTGGNVDWHAMQDTGTAPAAMAAFAAADVAAEPVATAVVRCPTADCPNEGVDIEVTTEFANEDGGTVLVDSAQCGACGTILGNREGGTL